MHRPSKLVFTGERVIPDAEDGKAWLPLHFARYCFARTLMRGQRILDVACGTGYGAAMLAGAGAETITGVDIDGDTIEYARLNYGQIHGVTFIQGSALDLAKLSIGPIDFCVSFETIEHLSDPERFLAEIRQVLVPGGQLLISTPNRYLYSPTNTDGCHPVNSFHLHEWTVTEFISVLSRYFEVVAVYGQECVRRRQAWAHHWTKRLLVGSGPPTGLLRSVGEVARRPPFDRLYRRAFGSSRLPPEGSDVAALTCEDLGPNVRVRAMSADEVPTYVVCLSRKGGCV